MAIELAITSTVGAILFTLGISASPEPGKTSSSSDVVELILLAVN